MSHSITGRFKENLVRQLVYFDENASELLDALPNTGVRQTMDDLLRRYCREVRRFMDGHGEEGPDTIVWIGSRVTIRNDTDLIDEELTIVLPNDADPFESRISFLSPVGQCLLLSRPGCSAEVDTPGGKYRLTVRKTAYAVQSE
ncbi:GreA/GreB family elongation factor [Cohnella caldifontis]|uniref:GreA/GreB family elongation factor n=1 Tax=Cohnella caldifontis TaxID=3027471 RepID=UPI0023ED2D37|nr:GreA/GreB family elongation factor [Cohnella sp. YIM B05605]